MTFAAPAARAVAGKAAGRAAARSSAKAAAGKAAKATTASDRAKQLLAAGTSRTDTARIIRDEYGSTLAEARSVLPPAQPSTPPTPPVENAEPGRPDAASPSGRPAPRPTSGGASATIGGLVLGVLAWAVGLTWLRSGPGGVKALLAAKFLNRTGAAAPATAGGSGRSGFGSSGQAGGGASDSGGGSW
ncbi:hypothetical protein Q6348_08040 [Isoptericola sp. b441]|uniref:DUF1707 domain-containing protein n=1 Tax=Actinotalea lenta TaxID=3064654 RepID=A0ABT9D8D7_9CELL|nr:hypothetical protein [Isoptericola sp. b441]MDO8107145.1 hypothetical protein [Isoptericola sp. b441]